MLDAREPPDARQQLAAGAAHRQIGRSQAGRSNAEALERRESTCVAHGIAANCDGDIIATQLAFSRRIRAENPPTAG